MRARELGRKSVVVGDRVALVGDTSGAAGALARIVRIAERTLGAAPHRGRRRHHRRGPAGTGGGGQRRPAGHRQRAGRPAAAHRVHRPLPGGRVRRRHRAAALPDQGRPGRPGRRCSTTTPSWTCRTCWSGRTPTSTELRALPRRAGLGHGRALRGGQVDPGQPAGAGRRPGGRRGQRDRPGPAHLDQRGGAAAAARAGRRRATRAGSSTPRASAASGWPTSRRTACCTASPTWCEGTVDCPPNCEHTADEADCALDAWVAAGKADPRRLASYRRLLASRAGEGDAREPSDPRRPPPATGGRAPPVAAGVASVSGMTGYADDLALAHRARRHRRRDLHGPVPRPRPAGRVEARPDPGLRRGHRRGAGDPRRCWPRTGPATACSARSTATQPAAGPDGRRWVIDPIDGTKNFVRGRADLGHPDRAAGGRPAGRSAWSPPRRWAGAGGRRRARRVRRPAPGRRRRRSGSPG